MSNKRVVFLGTAEKLKAIYKFCEEVYKRSFHETEWEERLSNLSLEDAMVLYELGRPYSEEVYLN